MPRSASPRGRPEQISVVLPVRNGELFIDAQLASLAAQTYAEPWELIVVDNGCTDRTVEIVESWRDRLPGLVVVDAGDRRGLNYARNRGAAAATGDFLAFCDADDVTEPGWLEALARAAPDADLVGGPMDQDVLCDELQRAWQPTDPIESLTDCYLFMPFPPGGNCGIWTDVAREVRWDEAFRFGASDIDFAWRLQVAGYRVGFAPGAMAQRRFKPTIAATVKQYFRYGVSEPHLFKLWGRHGMPRDLDEARRQWRWLAASLPQLRSDAGRGEWLVVAAQRLGRICGSVRWRTFYL